MGIGLGIFLIALGAILRWAVTASVSGISIQTIGVILMIAGLAVVVLSVVFWSAVGSWYPGRTTTSSRRYVEEDCSDGHCYP